MHINWVARMQFYMQKNEWEKKKKKEDTESNESSSRPSNGIGTLTH